MLIESSLIFLLIMCGWEILFHILTLDGHNEIIQPHILKIINTHH